MLDLVETLNRHRRGLGNPDFRDHHVNRSLDDVIVLLEREIERLQTSLEIYRFSGHPGRAELIAWHVRTLDERQDTLEELQGLIIAQREGMAIH
jgi:hypothetical protein